LMAVLVCISGALQYILTLHGVIMSLSLLPTNVLDGSVAQTGESLTPPRPH
jgi:hypothetical protein